MKRLLTVLILVCSFFKALGQYHVRFIVTEKTNRHHDSIYVTGTFNNWDSVATATYKMTPYGVHEKSIVLNLKKGNIQYKFTRGNWLTVEKQFGGYEVPNRIVSITKDTTLRDSILAYRDEMLIDKWQALSTVQPDSNRILLLGSIATIYAFLPDHYSVDSAFFYARQALLLLQQSKASKDSNSFSSKGYTSYFIDLQDVTASLLHSLGNYTKALELRLDNLRLAEQAKDQRLILRVLGNIISEYTSMKDYQNVLKYSRQMQSSINLIDPTAEGIFYSKYIAIQSITQAYYQLHVLDSALYYSNQLYKFSNALEYDSYRMQVLAQASLLLGDVYSKMGRTDSAIYYYRLALPNGYKTYQYQVISHSLEGIARLFQKEGRIDSALFYARASLATLYGNKTDLQAWGENTDSYIADISPLIASLYHLNNQPDSAYKYLLLSVTLKDSLYNVDKIRQFQRLTFNEAIRQQQQAQEAKAAQQRYENRIKIYTLIAGIVLALAIAFMLFRNNQQKQKANTLLFKKNREVESALDDLKATQAQLIQKEKMASLGELTAGIAHEIQNPLNFVNNFSETNVELADEAKTELKARNYDETFSLLADIQENSQKVAHHGKRAESIVKSMLEHSRTTKGEKQPTDINALCDEYLRLAYYGFRAKYKGFNTVMATQYDESIGKVNILPQDIGRVLLNLFNNAFWAVYEKKKQAGDGYEPTLTVSTKKENDKVDILIADNGSGIPQNLIAKVFQPFFTTKPTGEGTGLGLSLSYDIVKAHGGEIHLESTEGKGSTFAIQLPLSETAKTK